MTAFPFHKSAFTLALLLVVGAAAGCGNKRQDAVEPPLWQTEEGKQETRIGIARKMLAMGYADEAMTLLKLARDDGADGSEVDLLTGHALYLQGQYNEARILLEEVSETRKKDPYVWRTLGLVYADNEMPDQAIAAFQTAIELDDRDAATWNNLGFLLYTVKRSPDAVPALRKAVSLDGTVARYRRNLGFALFNEGDVDGAIDAFRAVGPPGDAWYNLGLAHELAGDPNSARERYARALQHDPEHNKAREALARLESQEAP